MGCSESILENENMSLSFLILLKKSDYKKNIECLNKVSKIKRIARKLPGNVIICELSDSKHVIKGLKVPYVVYSKLPKEGIYVSSDTWDAEYFNSQIMELIQIFTNLGAIEIRFNSGRGQHHDSSVTGHLGFKVNNVPVGLGADIEHEESYEVGNTFGGHIKIKKPKRKSYKSVDDFIVKNGLYYANYYPDWKALIKHKLETSTSILNFEYTFHRGFFCNDSLSVDLERIGIYSKLSMSNSSNNNIAIMFKIDFETDNLSLSTKSLMKSSEMDSRNSYDSCDVKYSEDENKQTPNSNSNSNESDSERKYSNGSDKYIETENKQQILECKTNDTDSMYYDVQTETVKIEEVKIDHCVKFTEVDLFHKY